MNITTVSETEIDSLQPLVAEFVRAHPSLPFRENHWQAFRTRLKKGIEDESILLLKAEIHGSIAGFILGDVRKNVPLFSPDSLGHVSVLIVSKRFRKTGIGDSLWNELRSRFESRGITCFELYTELGNMTSGPFWHKRGFETFLEKRRLL